MVTAAVQRKPAGSTPGMGMDQPMDGTIVAERLLLGTRESATPGDRPPVRIFLGTEPGQYRAERVFVWSVERVRDPGRVYEIYLMKSLTGFDRRRWTTGFTNYRYAIAHLAGNRGRAIYNDVDQIYLADPAELFDLDMAGHGFLAIAPNDTSVMLIDCARMASVWTIGDARRMRKKDLLKKALAQPGLYGTLAGEWNARDEGEYVAGRSRLLHYTCLHTQPWQPFPNRYAYQPNPVGHLWLELERSANEAGYQLFVRHSPSAGYRRLLGTLRAAASSSATAPAEPGEDLRERLQRYAVRTLLDYRIGAAVAPTHYGDIIASAHDPAGEGSPPAARFDAVVGGGGFDLVPDQDIPWMLAEMFELSSRLVYIAIDPPQAERRLGGERIPCRTRDAGWWQSQIEMAALRSPQVHWELLLRGRNRRHIVQGGWQVQAPAVWVLCDDRPGNRTQSIGLAEALGLSYTVKELAFNVSSGLHNALLGASVAGLDRARSAPIAPPWPDIVIACGRRTAPVARWIGRCSEGRTRLVQLGRKGAAAAEHFDITIVPAYCRLGAHPRRIQTRAPLTRVDPARLASLDGTQRRELEQAAAPRVVVLVGGATAAFRFDADTARLLAERVTAATSEAGGSLTVLTSRRTGAECVQALRLALAPPARLHVWQPKQPDNPYLQCLAAADILVVTSDSESMLAEAMATGKAVYVYPLPKRARKPLLGDRIAARAYSRPVNSRGTVRLQQGLEYLCARLIERGIVRPGRDLDRMQRELVACGAARWFGPKLDATPTQPLREIVTVTGRVRALLGLSGPTAGNGCDARSPA